MIGTVPIYDAVVYYHKALGKITSEEWIDIVRMHAEDGVDFMTIHCGMNRATAARFKQNKTSHEHCFQRWFYYVRMDGNDRKREPVL